ncbi:hypothetical protein [Stenotrophomonas sp. GZD-301]|uniref:hypothetical protein n=1 Tax=Stenotrophomonas sp. GZD-301 TaxID=3404814 RepID=UPI003BB69E9D
MTFLACVRSVRVAVVLMGLSLAGCGEAPSTPTGAGAVGPTPTATATAPSTDPAAALVARFNMGDGLAKLADEAARATTTFALMAEQSGTPAAKQRVQAEISRLLPAYQARWDGTLAAIYARHFSADALRSLASQGTRSPHAARFNALQNTVAAEMRTEAQPLLRQLVAEALTHAAQPR